jgi:type IV secretion system protein VirB10
MTTMRPIIPAAALSGVILFAAAPFHSAAPHAASSSDLRRLDREVTIPAGTELRLRVTRGFGSDFSRVEDSVTAALARSVMIDGVNVLSAGSRVSGYVSEARRPGKVKGRGRVAVRFTRITPANTSESYAIRTRPWVAVAPATKKKDAMTIGIPAAGGAMVGALVDGKKGAGIGAAVGGGAGTAVVLTTRGKDVRVGRGAILRVRLSEPLTILVDDE